MAALSVSAGLLPKSLRPGVVTAQMPTTRHRLALRRHPSRAVQTSGKEMPFDAAGKAVRCVPTWFYLIALYINGNVSVFADAGVTTDHRKHGPPTVFQKLGGRAAIEGVVDEFYSRVFVDDEVKGFFEGINKQMLKAHQVLCLVMQLAYLWLLVS